MLVPGPDFYQCCHLTEIVGELQMRREIQKNLFLLTLGQAHHTFSRFRNLQNFSRIFLCFAFLQERSFVLISKMPIQLFIRYLSRFFDCLVNQNLSSTLATDQKWSLSHLRISYQSLAECHLYVMYYVGKRTGWLGLENGQFCWRSVLYLCWHDSGSVGQKQSKIMLT